MRSDARPSGMSAGVRLRRLPCGALVGGGMPPERLVRTFVRGLAAGPIVLGLLLTLWPMRGCMTDLLTRITIDQAVCGGRPCIRGARIRVSDVLDLLAAGASTEEILRDYPYLEAADLLAVLKYAARRLNHPTIAA